MKKAIVIGMSILAFNLLGCDFKSEKVIKKTNEPEQLRLSIQPGKIEFCYDDEDFILTLRRVINTRDVYVSEDTYNSVREGQRINMDHIPYEIDDPEACL